MIVYHFCMFLTGSQINKWTILPKLFSWKRILNNFFFIINNENFFKTKKRNYFHLVLKKMNSGSISKKKIIIFNTLRIFEGEVYYALLCLCHKSECTENDCGMWWHGHRERDSEHCHTQRLVPVMHSAGLVHCDDITPWQHSSSQVNCTFILFN